MDSLLQPGDKVRIRKDIEVGGAYKMKTNSSTEIYVENMFKPGEEVTISHLRHGRYVIEEYSFYSYTDEMFDPDLIDYLLIEYLNK